LKVEGKIIGAMVTQSYSNDVRFHQADVDLFEYVSGQVALTIERKRIEEALKLDNQIMLGMVDGVFLYKDKSGEIIYANAQFEKMFGYDSGELLGKPVWILNAPTEKNPEEVSKQISEMLRKKGKWDGQIYSKKKDGKLFWSHTSVSTFEHSEFGTVRVSVHQDITQQKLEEIKLEYSSTHDSLTGLYNRTFFDEELKRFNKGRQFPISLIMVDVDYMKQVNDVRSDPAKGCKSFS
jgi:PAS domain S-box-containing protein